MRPKVVTSSLQSETNSRPAERVKVCCRLTTPLINSATPPKPAQLTTMQSFSITTKPPPVVASPRPPKAYRAAPPGRVAGGGAAQPFDGRAVTTPLSGRAFSRARRQRARWAAARCAAASLMHCCWCPFPFHPPTHKPYPPTHQPANPLTHLQHNQGGPGVW